MMVVLGGQGQGQGRQARFQLMPTSRINLKTFFISFFGGVVVWGCRLLLLGRLSGKLPRGKIGHRHRALAVCNSTGPGPGPPGGHADPRSLAK